MGILDTIPSISEIPEYAKILCYGHYGCGKTTFASTFPDPLWFDFEGSAETLRHLAETKDIKVERPKSMARAEQVLMEAVKPNSGFQTIVIDTANSMQTFQLAEYMKGVVARASNRDIDMPYQADYRKSTNQLQRLFNLLQDAPKNVVILCQERVLTEKDGDNIKIIGYRPDLTLRLADLVGAVIDVVGYLEKKPGIGTNPPKRSLYVNGTSKIVAKNRLGIQATAIENPTYESVFIKKGN